MGYLYEVVEFDPFVYDRRAHGGTVDSCIGTYLYVVFQYNISYLGNFYVRPIVWGETETVGSDDCSGMYNAMVANDTVMIDFHARVYYGTLAYFYIVANVYLRINFTALFQYGVFSDVGESSYIDRVGKGG